jgi:4-hydroxyphenylpyruvate dioxygenase
VTLAPVGVRGFGFLELWVGNARQAAAFFSSALDFSVVASAGPKTGLPDRASYVLTQGASTLVVTGATRADSPVAEFVHRHGDGVRDIALVVDHPHEFRDAALERGARPEPAAPLPPDGTGRETLSAFGDVIHTLIPGSDLADVVPGGFEPVAGVDHPGPRVGLTGLDHCAVSINGGTREPWARYYKHNLGFEQVDPDEHIEVDGSAFSMSTVRVPDETDALVLAEPVPSPRKSQIADYLEHFGGPGVHHIAFSTDNIAEAVSSLRQRGVRTLPVPASYYVEAARRLGSLDVPWQELASLGILVDVDDRGHLLQVFTEPLGDRPTTYLEIIQRAGTTGFGTQNVRYLYSAVARDQQLTGVPSAP